MIDVRVLLASSAVATGFVVAAPADAAVCLWDGGQSGDWRERQRWSCGRVPDATYDVKLGQAASPYRVTVSGAVPAIRSLAIASGATVRVTPGDKGEAGSLLVGPGTVRVDGLLDLRANASFLAASAGSAITLSGEGLVQLAGGTLANGRWDTNVSIFGYGQIGANTSVFANAGRIAALNDILVIDPRGDVFGWGGKVSGVAAFTNTGSVGAITDSVVLRDGLFENANGGSFFAENGAAFVMESGSRLANLNGKGVLDGGHYIVGEDASMLLRGDGRFITQIGTATGERTIVQLYKGAELLSAQPSDGKFNAAFGKNFEGVEQTGILTLSAFELAAQGSAPIFNRGEVLLDRSTLAGWDNEATGSILGSGTLRDSANRGVVQAFNERLAIEGEFDGSGGRLEVLAGSTLDISAAKTVTTGTLDMADGAQLALGSRRMVVEDDFSNAMFGEGQAFDARAGVDGTGRLDAASATQTLSGDDLVGNTIDFDYRVGSAGTPGGVLSISNLGKSTTLRGAVFDATGNAGLQLSESDFALAAGETLDLEIAAAAGFAQAAGIQSLGQLAIVNNFDNVDDASVAVTATGWLAAEASLFKAAGDGLLAGGGTTYTLDFGLLTEGDGPLIFELDVLNGAPDLAWTEALSGGFVLDPAEGFSFGGGNVAGLGGGERSSGFGLTFDAAGRAPGSYRTTLTFNGISHAPGLDDLKLAPITVNLFASVLAAAVPEPATWAQMIAGFAFVGGFARRQQRRRAVKADFQL